MGRQSKMPTIHHNHRLAGKVKLLGGGSGADASGGHVGDSLNVAANNCHASSQNRLALNVYKYANNGDQSHHSNQFVKLDRMNKLEPQLNSQLQSQSQLELSPPSSSRVSARGEKFSNHKRVTNTTRASGTVCTTLPIMDNHHRHLRIHKSLPPLRPPTARKAPLNNMLLATVALIVSPLLLHFQLAPISVSASPPVDYFIYTSQLMTAHAGAQNVTSMLPPLQDIYTPAPQANSSGSGGQIGDDNSSSNSNKLLLDQMAKRVMALVGNSSHEHDNNMADMEATRFAWSLMEKQALTYMRNRVTSLRPFIQDLLNEAQVSGACNGAILAWLDQLADLKQWATLMWNSWGQFPMAGVFQGSYTDLGSYNGCMRIDDNELIGQAQYCMLDFQPIVPTRPRFHSIFKRILGYNPTGRQLTNGDLEALAALESDGGEPLTGSHLSAHNVASSRYKELYRDTSDTGAKYGQSEQSVGKKLSLASILPPGLYEPAPSNANDNDLGNHNKYNKRTIVQINSLAAAANATEPATQGLSIEALANAAPEARKLNLTLKAEALIELALKAQYFYYVKFRIGTCLPTKCSKDDVSQLVHTASQRAILQSTQVNCMKKEPFSVNTYQLVAICILTTLALIAVLGAIVDLLGYKENLEQSSAFINWLLPFSMWTNAKRLFDLDTAGTHGDLECVHGLRFFSMIWVIYGHTILYMEYQSFTHFYDVIETQIPSFLLLPSLNANFSVDTFFVISGILTTYVTWEYTKGDPRKFNKFAFMISRYIRLTPQLAIVILCFFLLPLFGDGPMFRQVADEKAQVCYKNWAINLLYLQSYINSEKLCIDPSWWLSIEMTFHVVSVLVIIVMIHNVRRGMIVNFVVASVLTLWGAIIHYTNGFAIQYLPSIPQRYEVSGEQTQMFFHRPYPHAASYFIGIALGYVLANRTVKKLTRSQVSQGWIVCALGLVVSLWGSYYWNLGAPYTQLQATIYYNVCQILWPVSIAWIILACSLGHGGFVNSILSARLFVPLGRVTYMTYLSHALIIYYHSARMNITMEPSMLLFTYLFIANTTLALGLGVVLTVVYESPILNLQKQLFTYLTQKFDPTVRESRCRPTRLSPNTNGLVTGPAVSPPISATNGATIIIDEQNALLKHQPNGQLQQQQQQQQPVLINGFHSNHYHLTSRNRLNSPAANCLLLDQNNDKHKFVPEQHGHEGDHPTKKDDHSCNGV